MKNTRRLSICATSIAAFMAASPESPGVSYDVNLGDTFVEGGLVTGATGLTKTGGGSLILTNAGNNYTGVTTISDGSVVISVASALGTDPSGIVVTGFNPTLGQATNLRGFGGGSLVLSGLGGAITISRDLSLQGQGPIADRGGALISLGNNTLSGTVTTAPLAFGVTPINTTLISANGTLALSGPLNVQPAGAALATTTILGGTNQGGVTNYNLTGTLSGVGILSKQGGGTLFLNPSSTAGFSGSIRTNGSNASGQSTVRISSANVLGTRTATGTTSVLDLNGGILEVLMDAPVVNVGTGAANVYGRAGTTIFVDKSVGGSAINGTAAFGQFAHEENQTFTFNSRNGYGMSFGVSPVQGGNNTSTFNNNLQGGLLTFTGNFWSNTDNGANRTFNLGGNGDTLINGNIVATAAAFSHNFTKTGTGTLTVLATGTTLDGNFNINGGTVATRQIVGGILGAGTAAGTLNIGTGGTTGTLNYLGSAGSGAGETLSRTITLAGTQGGARINANQTGSAATALIINGPVTFNDTVSAKTLTLGGTASSSIENRIDSSLNPGTNTVSLAKTDSATWVLAGVNTYTGTTTISNGTLRLAANAGASTILADTAPIAFNADAVQAAGGRLVLSGFAATPTTETVGTLGPVQGHGTVRVENGGALTTLAVAGLTPASGSIGASVNFEAPTATDVVTLGGTVDTIPRGNAYFNGGNFAYIGAGNVLRAPNYGVDPLTATTAAGPLTAGQHNEITGSFSDAGGTTTSSLKFSGSHTLTLTGTASVNLGVQTVGGILVDGGNAVIAQGGGGAITQGATSGALVIRVNQLTDSLALQVPILATTNTGLAKNGLGTLILSAANNQGGGTNINEGTIQLAPGARLSATNGNLTIRQGATLDLNGVTQLNNTIGALNGAGTVTNSSATPAEFAFGNNNQGGTFSGIIQDGVGRVNVLKQSGGGPALTGLNTYTGSTTINATGTIGAPNLADIGSPSAIGAGDGTSAATNAGSLVFNGAQLVQAATGVASPGGLNYTGTQAVSTDRLFTLASNAAGAGARLVANGVNSAPVVFSNTGAVQYTAAGGTVAQTLVLSGASTGDNRIDIQLVSSGAGGSLAVNKQDAGRWVLGNSSNSYTGATKINGGVLEANDGTSLPASSALLFGGTLAIPTGGVLESNGTFTRALNAGTVAGSVNFNANGNFPGSGGFASSGSKLTVNLGGASAPLTWGTGGFLMPGTAAATLRLNSATALGEVEFQNPIDLNGTTRTIQVDENANIGADFATLSGALSGAGGELVKNGAGTLALTGANTYTGTTTVLQGTIVVRSLGNSGSPGATSVGDSTAGNTDTGAVMLGNAGTGAGILQYVGAGETSDRKIRLNTTTGTTQIHADGSGALILTNVANDVATGAKNLTLRGTNAAGNTIANTLTDSPIGGGTAALPLSVTVDGSATWILSAANAYTGNTNSNAGAIGVGNDAAFGPSGTVVLNNGNIFAYSADRTVANPVQLQNNTTQGFLGDFSLSFTSPLNIPVAANNAGINNNISAPGKTLTFAGATANALTTTNRVLTVDGPGETIFSGDLTTTSTAAGLALTKTGTGILALNGAAGNFNQFGANIDIDNGTVRLGATNAIPSGAGYGGVVFSPDNGQGETPILNLNGFSQTINSVTGTNTSASTIDNASGTAVALTIGAFNGAVNSNAAITSTGGGAISIVKTGTAAGVLSGTSIAIGGTTTIQSGGSLAFTGADPSGTTGITVQGGAGLSVINGVGSNFASLASLNLGGAASTTALGLDVGTVTDKLQIAGAATTAGTVALSIGAAPGFGSSPTYTLLQAASGLSGATYVIDGVVPGGYTYSLTPSDTQVILGIADAAQPFFFWTGDQNGSWATYKSGNTNWEDGSNVDTASTPGFVTPGDGVVVFSSAVNKPAGQAVITTLDLPFTIDSLQFNGNNTSTAAARVAIAPGIGGTLTIQPFVSTDGIEIANDGGIASITAPITLAADQTWTVSSVGALRPELIVTGPLSGTGNLVKAGGGTATVTGNSTRTGRTTIDSGTLRINAEAALGANPGALTANQLELNGGILRSTAAFAIDDTNRGVTITALGGTFDTTGGNITVGSTAAPGLNIVSGGGALRKEGGNTLILNSVNTYTGGTVINGGAVRAGDSSALGTGGVSLVNTGTIVELGDGVNVTNVATVADTGNDKTFRLQAGATAATYSGSITVSELTAGNFRAQASANGTLTLSGAITTTGTAAPGLRVNEAAGNTGVVVLASAPGANTYGGTTEVRQGTLRNGASDQIPGALTVNAAVAASPSATYDLAGNNETVTALTYGANGSSNAAYVNTVTTGAGTLTLGGNVTTNANPGGSQVGTAVLAGNVAMAATRTFTVANATSVATDLLVSAAITGAGGLTKAGAGTMEMTGTSTYAGVTTVNAGTLLVNGSISGTVTTAGGTLGGSGSVGAITATTGTVSPGASIGTLTATSLTMTGATLALEINTTNQTTDLINTSGPLSLALGGTPLTVADLGANVALPLGTKFTFLTYNGAQTGLFSFGGNAINDDIDSFLVGANLFAIDYNDNSGSAVSLVVVPEPGIAASLLGGFGMLVGLQRIRRRSDRRA